MGKTIKANAKTSDKKCTKVAIDFTTVSPKVTISINLGSITGHYYGLTEAISENLRDRQSKYRGPDFRPSSNAHVINNWNSEESNGKLLGLWTVQSIIINLTGCTLAQCWKFRRPKFGNKWPFEFLLGPLTSSPKILCLLWDPDTLVFITFLGAHWEPRWLLAKHLLWPPIEFFLHGRGASRAIIMVNRSWYTVLVPNLLNGSFWAI